jgi:predicted enzyme related to lactoylglutathione lyase
MTRRVFQVEIRARALRNAVPFYRAVFDWKIYPAAADYALVDTGALPIVGIMESSGALGLANYVLVDDCEHEASRAVAYGGRVTVERSEVPDNGLFMAVSDPWGTDLWFWQPYKPATPKPQGSGANPIVLVEIAAPDLKAARVYYEAILGAGFDVAAGMPAVSLIAGPAGVVDYVTVANLRETATRVTAAGGLIGVISETRMVFNDVDGVGMGAIQRP